MAANISEEYKELIKRAQEQPGVTELMEVYGQYDELLKQSYEYLSNAAPKTTICTTDSTS